MQSLLTDPDAFFRDESDDPDLVVSAIIVALASVLSAASGWLLLDPATQAAPAGQQGAVRIGLQVTYASTVLLTLVLWGVFAGVFYGVSSLFDGEGSFLETLTLAGWGYVPSVVSGALSFAATAMALEKVGPPARGVEVQAFLQQVNGHEYMLAANVASLLLLVWQAVLWTYAVKHARNVDRNQAAVAVALPILLLLALGLLGLTGSL